MPQPSSPVITELRTAIGLLDNDTVAELLGVPANQPGAWLRGESIPTATDAARIAAVRDLAGALTRVYTQQMALHWLNEPTPDFADETPLAAFTAGQHDAVLNIALDLQPDVSGWPI